MEHTHTISKNGKKHNWYVKRLWELSKSLPVFEYKISSFPSFDKDIWFGDKNEPTVNKVLEHHQKISEANCDYPIILSEDGTIMDGVHRVCRAHIDGKLTIKAVQFKVNPEPDEIY